MQSLKGLPVLFIIFLLFQLNLHSTTKAEENSAFNADSKSQPILRTNNDTNTTINIDSTTTDNTTLNNTNATITTTPTNISTTIATLTNISTTITTPTNISTTIATLTNISTTITTPNNISTTITTPNNTNTTITTPSNISTTITTPTNINSTITTPNNTNTTITTPNNISTTATATTHTTTATSSPNLITLHVCDFFNKSCLVSGVEYVTITDGSLFADAIAQNSSEPPKGPVSSAASVCTYGLVPFVPGAPDKIVTMSVNHNSQYRAQANGQCLRYYYYIPNSNDTLGWNKIIEVYINNETHLIDTVTTANMTTNGWEKGAVNINVSTNIYNLSFKFKVVNISATETSSNKSIYFALDNIQLSNRDCSYLPENNTNGSTPTMPSTTTSTVSSLSNEPDIPLILGLTLGLGLPLILVTIAFIVYYVRVHTRGKPYRKDSAELDIPRMYSTDRYVGDNQILTTTF
ncbi:unnamed protein product [Adineta steineri]|uniref:MAM domain-containing protein n=1 Tax=Adineta steineri TaxID=433720 RepID=A0A819QQH8_9BILA|nr:unnamed protein product [Adineta steineri]CAF4033279.1 unnamed protein product [Adineta steineri]